jgi:hypothetical protein
VHRWAGNFLTRLQSSAPVRSSDLALRTDGTNVVGSEIVRNLR